MIQWEEKLCYVKSQGAYHDIFDLSCTDEVSESNSSISCWSLFETTQLTLVDKIVQNHMKLKTFTNNFFNKLFQDIEKNNRFEWFWKIIQLFIEFQNNNSYRSFEVGWPVT